MKGRCRYCSAWSNPYPTTKTSSIVNPTNSTGTCWRRAPVCPKGTRCEAPAGAGSTGAHARVQCGTRIDNVLDDQYILSAHVAWLQAPDESLGGYCFPSIARTAYEVDRDRPRKCARQVGQKHESPGEHANKMDGNLEWGLGLDSGGQLCHPLLNSSRREKRATPRCLQRSSPDCVGILAFPERVSLAWPAGLLSLSSVPSL